MYVNMRDNYMDCPTRERAQWWGDVVNQLKEGFYTFDTKSHDLGKKAISQLASWQEPGGVLYSPMPSTIWTAELPNQMLASVWSFWTFHLYTGDTSTVTGAYPAVKKYLDLWSLGSDGLVAHRGGDWDWQDWGSNIDARVLNNSWYYLALDTAAKLAALSGNTGDVAGWQAQRDSIKANFDSLLELHEATSTAFPATTATPTTGPTPSPWSRAWPPLPATRRSPTCCAPTSTPAPTWSSTSWRRCI